MKITNQREQKSTQVSQKQKSSQIVIHFFKNIV